MKPPVVGILALALSMPRLVCGAEAASAPRQGRGWIFGGGFGVNRTSISGAGDLALVVGPRIGSRPIPSIPPTNESLELRSVRLARRPATASWDEQVIPFPSSQNEGSLSVHVGWAFSGSLAVLLDADVAAGWAGGLHTLSGGVVARYSPTRRLWIQAGPASADIDYTFGRSVTVGLAHGSGVRGAAGVALRRRQRWRLDLEVRAQRIWYDAFDTATVGAQFAIARQP